ncbi:MAG: hypothetical protein ACR2FY_23635 [Pirellulaceae bacterium]
MASAAPRRLTRVKTDVAQLGTSKYEQASAMLSSMLLLLGMMTIVMFLVWLSATIIWDKPVARVTLEDVGGGGSGNMAGDDKNLEEPNPEEVPEVVELKVDQPLESIATMVSTEVVALDAVTGETSFGKGEGTGTGDGRGKGPGGPGTSDGIPAWERWEIKFSANEIDVYAQQLDFFKVELGVAGGGIEDVDYCSNFSAATPQRRSAKPKDEKRLCFLYKAGNLREADRTLARKAGIQVSDRVVFQFYTQEMYTRLLTLENEKMGKRRIIEVKKTTFGIRGAPGKWEFYVIDQQYRAPTAYKAE